MNNTTNKQPASLPTSPSTETARSGGWLWVSAGVLAAFTIVQGAGLIDRPAYAEMAASTPSYSLMTTAGGSSEIVAVIDDRNETLMVYQPQNRNRLRLLERESLPELFARARANAGLPPRP